MIKKLYFTLVDQKYIYIFFVQIEATNSTTASFTQVRIRALSVCAWLQELGLKSGESTIALQGPNSLHLAPLLLGAWKAGLACALINPTSTERKCSF